MSVIYELIKCKIAGIDCDESGSAEIKGALRENEVTPVQCELIKHWFPIEYSEYLEEIGG